MNNNFIALTNNDLTIYNNDTNNDINDKIIINYYYPIILSLIR
jgi:hypothetical protein